MPLRREFFLAKRLLRRSHVALRDYAVAVLLLFVLNFVYGLFLACVFFVLLRCVVE